MAEQSGISWTDATFNPWIGCTKVSNGALGACVNCYAESDNKRRGWVPGWGSGEPRKRTKTWNEPRKWNAHHIDFYLKHRRKRRVFCASLADVFDNEVPQAWRDDLFLLIGETPSLHWLLLTKRIGNAAKMIPDSALGKLGHVGIMSTIVTQEEWDRDYPKLREVCHHFGFGWHGISDEPTLAPIDIGGARPDWIITGGESGSNRRPLNMDYVRSMRDQCARNGVTFHHKQNGGLRGKDTGCLVDGVEHKHFPEALAA